MSIQENIFVIPCWRERADSRRALVRVSLRSGAESPPFCPCSAGSSWALGLGLRRKWLESHPPQQWPLPRGSPGTSEVKTSLTRDPPLRPFCPGSAHKQHSQARMEQVHTSPADWLEPERWHSHWMVPIGIGSRRGRGLWPAKATCLTVLWVPNSPIKKERLGFPSGAVVENLPANARDTGSSPGLGRSHMPRSN